MLIKSLTNRTWNVKHDSPGTCNNLVEIIMQNRGLQEEFIETSIKNSMPDPYIFVDMKRAVERIVQAVEHHQPIAILGDYDVDGVTSTAIFLSFFRAIGTGCRYKIPNRMKEGYGLNSANIDAFRDCLIIAVDNGSSAFDELKYAHDTGIEIVVIDHHEMQKIPPDTVIVNPFRPDDQCEFTYLCAAGLAFMCVIGVNRLLRDRGFYQNSIEPNLMEYVDLVALATICDVVPLVGLNRAFVRTGLKVLSQGRNLGLKSMMQLAAQKNVNSESVGFFFGPRLNAAGRLSTAELSLQLLTTQDKNEAENIVRHLESLNEQRKQLDEEIFRQAELQVDVSQHFICAFEDNWHAGVIGIVAGRLKEKYNLPAIVISCDGDDCHASCRSPEYIDISKVIKKGIDEKVIASGGGHASAGGFVIKKEKIADLITFLKKYDFPPLQEKSYDVECFIDANCITLDMIKQINSLEPFGEGNPRPYFVLDLIIEEIKLMKDAHLSIKFYGQPGIRGVAFKVAGTKLESMLKCNIGNKVHVLGQLSIGSWNSLDYINLLVEDVSRI